MNIIIHGRNTKVNDALEDFTRRKVERLDRYLPNITDVRVDFTQESTRRGESWVAQITVRHRRGAILRAEESDGADAQGALNLALDKMYQRIQRFKGKRIDRSRGRFAADHDELSAAEALPEAIAVDEVDSDFPEIARRKEVIIAAMNEEEAIEQMELLGHAFYLFFNERAGKINVVYKRRAGGYGILDPVVE